MAAATTNGKSMNRVAAAQEAVDSQAASTNPAASVQLGRRDRELVAAVGSDVWSHTFHLVDAEPELTAADAAAVAKAASDAAEKALAELLA